MSDQLKAHQPGTRTAVLMITVPTHWQALNAKAIAAKLRQQPGGVEQLVQFLAEQVHACLQKPDILDAKVMGEKLIKGEGIGP